jgi:hypothetical protein
MIFPKETKFPQIYHPPIPPTLLKDYLKNINTTPNKNILIQIILKYLKKNW